MPWRGHARLDLRPATRLCISARTLSMFLSFPFSGLGTSKTDFGCDRNAHVNTCTLVLRRLDNSANSCRSNCLPPALFSPPPPSSPWTAAQTTGHTWIRPSCRLRKRRRGEERETLAKANDCSNSGRSARREGRRQWVGGSSAVAPVGLDDGLLPGSTTPPRTKAFPPGTASSDANEAANSSYTFAASSSAR